MVEDKSFFSKWKDGIESTTPIQLARVNMWSNMLMLIGAVCGFVVSLYSIKTLWWLALIMLGTSIMTLFQQFATWQRYKMLKLIEIDIKADDDNKNAVVEKLNE